MLYLMRKVTRCQLLPTSVVDGFRCALPILLSAPSRNGHRVWSWFLSLFLDRLFFVLPCRACIAKVTLVAQPHAIPEEKTDRWPKFTAEITDQISTAHQDIPRSSAKAMLGPPAVPPALSKLQEHRCSLMMPWQPALPPAPVPAAKRIPCCPTVHASWLQ